MILIKRLLDFFLYSNIFISLCASALTFETYLISEKEINWLYLIFVFLSTFVLYNVQRLFYTRKNISETKSERHKWIFENKKLLMVLSMTALTATAVIVFFFPLKFILWFFPAGLASLFYFIPQINLRAIPLMKAGVVAFVWTCVTYFYPHLLLSANRSLSIWVSEGWEGTSRFFFLSPLAIAFNIRDVEVDKNSGVKTLPVLFGIQKTKIICVFFLMTFSVMIIFSPSPFDKVVMGLIFSSFVTAILICFASKKRSEYFYSLWMDGMMIFQMGLVVLQNFSCR
ncbi:MAG: hypothetical protein AABZ32_00040 [Bacteroidota bacterium]